MYCTIVIEQQVLNLCSKKYFCDSSHAAALFDVLNMFIYVCHQNSQRFTFKLTVYTVA